MSTPSSSVLFVRRTGRQSGPAAVNTLRRPRSSSIQAMRSAFFAATRLAAVGTESACSIV